MSQKETFEKLLSSFDVFIKHSFSDNYQDKVKAMNSYSFIKQHISNSDQNEILNAIKEVQKNSKKLYIFKKVCFKIKQTIENKSTSKFLKE